MWAAVIERRSLIVYLPLLVWLDIDDKLDDPDMIEEAPDNKISWLIN